MGELNEKMWWDKGGGAFAMPCLKLVQASKN